MVVMLVIGLTLFGYACWLVLHAAGLRRTRVEETIAGMQLYGFQGRTLAAEKARTVTGHVNNLATAVGTFVASHTGLMREEDLRKELRSAGMYSTSPLR